MKKTGIFLVFISLFVFMQQSCLAQIVDPVKFTVSGNDSQIVFKGTIEKGWHVYSVEPDDNADGPTWAKLNVKELDGVELVGGLQPEGNEIRIFDEMFGMELCYYEDSVTFVQKIHVTKDDYTLNCSLEYGACNEEMCIPPAEVEYKVSPSAETTEESAGNSLWEILLAGIVGGLLALLTPCVWPMMPMTVSFFLKRNKDKRKAIREAIIYGISIIVIYLLLGIAVTLIFGAAAMNNLATNAIANIFFALLLVVFALSFFGLFELRLPDKWGNKIDDLSLNASKGGGTLSGILSIFLMALVLVIVSFSCTGPLIGVLLVGVAATGDLLAPAVGMFGFALALAVPFAIFAIFPNWLNSMPKSGSWMNIVKVSLAFIELAFALKFLSVADLAYGWGILPRWLFIALWALIFLAMGVYGIMTIIKNRKALILKLIVTIFGLVLGVYMVTGFFGNPLKQVSAFLPPMEQSLNENHYEDYYLALKAAEKQGKPVFIDFTGYGCVNCRKMEAAVFTDPEVKRLMEEEYITVTLYVDDKRVAEGETESIGAKWSRLQQDKYGANAQPYYVLIDAYENQLAEPRSYNEDIKAFIEFLNKGLQ